MGVGKVSFLGEAAGYSGHLPFLKREVAELKYPLSLSNKNPERSPSLPLPQGVRTKHTLEESL